MAVALLVALVVGLIAYKIVPALRAVQSARLTGMLNLHPYLASQRGPVTLVAIWMESLAYLRIIWPALVFGILIAAGAHIAIPPDWIARNFNRSKAYSMFAGAAAGVPLMLCSCCVAPVFEGVYARTRRLDTSLALMLAPPSLNPAGLTLTFMLFPIGVAIGRVTLAAVALIGIASIARRVSSPLEVATDQPLPDRYESLAIAYLRSVVHVALRTTPLILVGIPAAILIFHLLGEVSSLGTSSSIGMVILFVMTVLLLPMPTLFEIPLAYSLLLIGLPLGVVIAVLFAGPAVNLPSLLIVGRTAGIKASLLLTAMVGGLAIATAFMFPR